MPFVFAVWELPSVAFNLLEAETFVMLLCSFRQAHDEQLDFLNRVDVMLGVASEFGRQLFVVLNSGRRVDVVCVIHELLCNFCTFRVSKEVLCFRGDFEVRILAKRADVVHYPEEESKLVEHFS